MIDLHTHILPNVDDGSSSLEESLALLRMLASQGVTLTAATPHFYATSDTPEQFFRRREAAWQLRDLADGAQTETCIRQA